MKKIFYMPEKGQHVILTDGLGRESTQRIVYTSKTTIRVSSCNIYKFRRDGCLHKADMRGRSTEMRIKPIDFSESST